MPGKLTYFNGGFRAEAIRALLGHANFQYEDERHSPEEFKAVKESGKLPLGSMPIWEEDGSITCQSNAILRFLAIRLGYYTTDAQIAWNIDSIMDYSEDIYGKFAGFMAPLLFGGQLDETKADAWITGFWTPYIKFMEARLAAHGKTFVGGTDTVTCADFKCFQVCVVFLPENSAMALPDAIKAKIEAVIAQNPSYSRWLAAMKSECSAYLQARPAAPF